MRVRHTLAATLALAVSAGLVWSASQAAFTASTSNDGNAVSSGDVVISSEGSGSTLIDLTDIAPGQRGETCVRVTYSGSLPAGVSLYATTANGDLAPYVDLAISEGWGGDRDSCSGFRARTVSVTDTVADLASRADFDSGVGFFAPVRAGQQRTYRIGFALDPQVPDALQGEEAALSLTWQARGSVPPARFVAGGGETGGNGGAYLPVFTAVGDERDWTDLAISLGHGCGVRAEGTLWCWGANWSGQVGDGTSTDRPLPTQVGTETTWKQVAIGEYHSCATRTDLSLWCWGRNDQGQLGDGSTTLRLSPVEVGPAQWTSVTVSSASTCALDLNGFASCWGYGARGELGNGGTAQSSVPVAVDNSFRWYQLVAGSVTICGLRDDATLWCWGSDKDGSSGTGSSANTLSPARIAPTRTFAHVGVGQYHGCAVTDGLDGNPGGELWCWGENYDGQAGISSYGSVPVPTRVGTDTDWAAMTGGAYWSCATKVDRSLWCFGQTPTEDSDYSYLPDRSESVPAAATLAGGGASYESQLVPWPTFP